MFEKFEKTLEKGEEILSLAIFLLMLVTVTLQVFWRYVLSNPLQYTDEVSRLTLVWITFLGGAIAYYKGSHVRVDFFLEKTLPASVRPYFYLSIHVAVIFFLAILGKEGVELTRQMSGLKSSGAGLPLELLYISSVVGPCLIMIHAILKAIVMIRRLILKKECHPPGGKEIDTYDSVRSNNPISA